MPLEAAEAVAAPCEVVLGKKFRVAAIDPVDETVYLIEPIFCSRLPLTEFQPVVISFDAAPVPQAFRPRMRT